MSVPFGDNDKYDLVLDTGAALFRVQCKTGWIEDDVVRFKTGSKTTSGGEVELVGYGGSIDAFAVRCENTDACYWVPLEEVGRRNTYLRLSEPEIDHPSVNRGDRYRFDANLPEREDD